MESLRIPASNDAIPEGISFITTALKKRRIRSKEASRAILMAEEVMVKLFEHAAPGAEAKLSVVSVMGSLSLKISVPGGQFEFGRDVDLCLGLDVDAEDSQAEASIRDLLLNAFRDKLRYRHRGGCNIVQIAVKESERRLLYWTVAALLSSIALGLILRELLPQAAAQGLDACVLTPVKTMFLNALKMIVAPVVFFSILSCVSQFTNLSDFGRTGAKVMGFYMFTTVIAIAVGTAAFFLLRPGEPGSQAVSAAAQSAAEAEAAEISILDTIVNIVPSNIIAPFVNSDMLQIIFIAILCGAAVGMLGEYSKPLKDFFEACNSLFLKVTTIIVSVIPLAVFCSICSLVMLTGTDTLLSLLYFLLTVVAGMAGMIAVYCLIILAVARLDPLVFLRKHAPGMLTAFSLGSSNASMPYNMQICRNDLGISPKVYSFSIPLGATVNMDGTCIYLVAAAMFLARIYGVELTGPDMAAMFFSVFVLSVGAPGVPGSGLVCLSVLLVQLGIPVEGAGLIMAIDSIVGMFRCLSNTTGDVAITLVVAKLEKLMDTEVYYDRAR